MSFVLLSVPGHRVKLEDQKMQFSNRLSEIEHYQRSMRIGPVNNNPRPQGMTFKKYFWGNFSPHGFFFFFLMKGGRGRGPDHVKKIVVKGWLFLKSEIHSHQHRGLCQGKYIKSIVFVFQGEKCPSSRHKKNLEKAVGKLVRLYLALNGL